MLSASMRNCSLIDSVMFTYFIRDMSMLLMLSLRTLVNRNGSVRWCAEVGLTVEKAAVLNQRSVVCSLEGSEGSPPRYMTSPDVVPASCPNLRPLYDPKATGTPTWNW